MGPPVSLRSPKDDGWVTLMDYDCCREFEPTTVIPPGWSGGPILVSFLFVTKLCARMDPPVSLRSPKEDRESSVLRSDRGVVERMTGRHDADGF